MNPDHAPMLSPQDRRPMSAAPFGLLLLILLVMGLTGCGSRQVQDSLVGSTAQRLVSYAIDDLARALPESDFAGLAGQTLWIESHFVANSDLRHYADRRLAMELASRFDIEVVEDRLLAEHVLTVFYTSLGTDEDFRGFYLPLGFVPGLDAATRINLITLEKFHGVAEMYYYLGRDQRGDLLQSRQRTDALGLPIITIPLSTLP